MFVLFSIQLGKAKHVYIKGYLGRMREYSGVSIYAQIAPKIHPRSFQTYVVTYSPNPFVSFPVPDYLVMSAYRERLLLISDDDTARNPHASTLLLQVFSPWISIEICH